MLPILLNLTGKCVLIVGGGTVGRRKARAAIAGGATVRVVALEPRPEGWTAIEWLHEPYREEQLVGVALVVAAATADVNERVVRDARRRGVWVNSATDPAVGDFALPAVVRRGELTIAVNTGGAAPALARRIREKLETEFDDTFATWVRLLDAIRSLAHERVPDPARRRDLLDGFADWPWLQRLRAEGEAATWRAMLERVG